MCQGAVMNFHLSIDLCHIWQVQDVRQEQEHELKMSTPLDGAALLLSAAVHII